MPAFPPPLEAIEPVESESEIIEVKGPPESGESEDQADDLSV